MLRERTIVGRRIEEWVSASLMIKQEINKVSRFQAFHTHTYFDRNWRGHFFDSWEQGQSHWSTKSSKQIIRTFQWSQAMSRNHKVIGENQKREPERKFFFGYWEAFIRLTKRITKLDSQIIQMFSVWAQHETCLPYYWNACVWAQHSSGCKELAAMRSAPTS